MIRMLVVLVFGVAVFSTFQSGHAHELRPGYLELRQTSESSYDLIWKVPARGDRRLALHVKLPPDCVSGEISLSRIDNAFIERWQTKCDGGLSGREISIGGLRTTLTDVLVRLQRPDGTTQVARLTPDQPAFTVSETRDRTSVIKTYFVLGVEHILAGIDHLLFVLALLLIVSGWRRLLATITSFTVAHSITLAAATLGLLWLPRPPVEAVIALSIMFLASELVRISYGEGSLTAHYSWVVTFAFGLLHGLGFAGALADIGLPQNEIPLSLLMFNIGVEAGQILFIAAAAGTMWCLDRLCVSWPGWARYAPAYGIGTISAFWLVERVSGFW